MDDINWEILEKNEKQHVKTNTRWKKLVAPPKKKKTKKEEATEKEDEDIDYTDKFDDDEEGAGADAGADADADEDDANAEEYEDSGEGSDNENDSKYNEFGKAVIKLLRKERQKAHPEKEVVKKNKRGRKPKNLKNKRTKVEVKDQISISDKELRGEVVQYLKINRNATSKNFLRFFIEKEIQDIRADRREAEKKKIFSMLKKIIVELCYIENQKDGSRIIKLK